jgi:ABC-type bacteriocin/lantibiotic exporter with double-glycine peptidase domain
LEEFLISNEGVHTMIGEQGNKISGGQRQRLGLARALLTKPNLLILDEATSSLDAETEQQISEFLLSMKGNMTMVVVAHRLSTIMKADRIVYVADGRILGVGEFDLLRSKIPEFDLQAVAMGL